MSATPCLVLTGDVAVATRSDAGDGPRNKRWPSWNAGWSAGCNASLLASHVASLDKHRLSRQTQSETHPETHADQTHPVTFALSWCASLAQLRQMHTPPDPTPPWHAGMCPSHTQHPHSSSAMQVCTHTTHPPTHTHAHFVSSSSLGGGKNTHAVTESYMIWPRSARQLLSDVTRVHTSHAAACCHVCTRPLLPHASCWRMRHRLRGKGRERGRLQTQ